MAIKIIEEPSSIFEVKCFHCGCRFTYEIEDVTGPVVMCPHCSAGISHSPKNAQMRRSNRKKEVPLNGKI